MAAVSWFSRDWFSLTITRSLVCENSIKKLSTMLHRKKKKVGHIKRKFIGLQFLLILCILFQQFIFAAIVMAHIIQIYFGIKIRLWQYNKLCCSLLCSSSSSAEFFWEGGFGCLNKKLFRELHFSKSLKRKVKFTTIFHNLIFATAKRYRLWLVEIEVEKKFEEILENFPH